MSKDKFISIFCIFLLSIVFVLDYVNYVQYNLLSYDESYNATVAANFFRYGVYRVSYPSEIVFYNLITTGPALLLPTALLYKIFGISNLTTSITPIIYSVLTLWLMFIFFVKCLKDRFTKVWCVSFIAVFLIVLSDNFYYDMSVRLLGEIAAIFLFLISFICVYQYWILKKDVYLMISGATLITSFLTKSSMFFFFISFLFILLIETFFTKSIKKISLLKFFIGFFVAFAILESLKLIQLGGFSKYYYWWIDEFKHMLNSSSGIDFNHSIAERLNFLESIFVGCNKYFCIFMILLPIITYSCFFFKRIKNKETKDMGFLTMSICGVCGASLLVFFIFFGGGSLFLTRRHKVYQLFIRLFSIYFFIYLILFFKLELSKLKGVYKNSIKRAIYIFVIIISIVVIPFVSPINKIKSGIDQYLKKESQDTYPLFLMKEFLKEIDRLPKDVTLYTAGWWQEPMVTLLLDRKMKNLYSISPRDFLKNSYFIAGNLINNISIEDIKRLCKADVVKIDKSKTDYNRFNTGLDRKDIENFSIYKIKYKYPKYKIGEKVSFTTQNDNGRKFVLYGLSFAEDGYSWTDGHEVSFYMRLKNRKIDKCKAKINVTNIFNNKQRLIIYANNEKVFEKDLKRERKIEFEIKNNNKGRINIRIELPDAISPISVDQGQDARKLGIRIKDIEIS